jgi:lysophospholipase L1-like esterase
MEKIFDIAKDSEKSWGVIAQGIDGNFKEVEQALYGVLYEIKDIDGYERHNGLITSDGNWGSLDNPSYQYIVIPIENVRNLKIQINTPDEYSITCAGLKSYDISKPADFSDDENWNTRKTIFKRFESNLPNDVRYVYLLVLDNDKQRFPTLFHVWTEMGSGVFDELDEINNKIEKIHTQNTIKTLIEGNILTADNLLIGQDINSNGDPYIYGQNTRAITPLLKNGNSCIYVKTSEIFITKLLNYDGGYKGDFAFNENGGQFIVPANMNFRLSFRKKDESEFTLDDVIENNIVSFESDFHTIKWFALGDSITEGWISYLKDGSPTSGVIKEKCWVSKVARLRNDLVLTNYGVGGQGYLIKNVNGENGKNAKDFVQTIDFSNADIVTLAYGINDWKGNQMMGSITTENSVLGNMAFVIEKILSDNPSCKIYVILPLNCYGYNFDYGTEETNWALGYNDFPNTGTLESFVAQLKSVSAYYGIETIDMTHNSVVNRKSLPYLLIDGVHPSEFAHSAIAREIAYKL